MAGKSAPCTSDFKVAAPLWTIFVDSALDINADGPLQSFADSINKRNTTVVTAYLCNASSNRNIPFSGRSAFEAAACAAC
jgi:hypothetical protein